MELGLSTRPSTGPDACLSSSSRVSHVIPLCLFTPSAGLRPRPLRKDQWSASQTLRPMAALNMSAHDASKIAVFIALFMSMPFSSSTEQG
jgi:hypothetical protein